MEGTATLTPTTMPRDPVVAGRRRPAASPPKKNNHASLRYLKQRQAKASDTSKVRPPSNRSQQQQQQRLSAHKVSLFRYGHVSAMSCTGGVLTSAGDLSQARSPLLPPGPLELYQIVTPAPNCKGKAQEMNYLSLGRQGNIVHPILPRLQVTRLGTRAGSFLIAFYNPERYWELEFLASPREGDLEAAVSEFERAISRMCVYTKSGGCAPDDDLDYLLVDDGGCAGGSAGGGNTQVSDQAINEAFKRAIQLVMPPLAAQRRITRRFSSYVTPTCAARQEPAPSKRMSQHVTSYRRVFSDTPPL